MRTSLIALVAVLGLQASVFAEATAQISNVHLCCKGCVTGAEKAVGEVSGAKATADQDASTVTISAPDAATLQKAADALVAGGYFGKSDTVKMKVKTGAKGQKVQTMTVEGVHLCCGKCVKAVDKAVLSVSGVKSQNATKGAKTFEVTGDFNDKEVFTALEKEGLAGKVAK